MVIIEKDGVRYEAVELIEDSVEDIETAIATKIEDIDNITFTNIEVLELLLANNIIEQEVLDMAKNSNKMKEDELALLENELVTLELKLED